MGQRHQVYMALPPCKLCKGTGKRSDMIVPDGCNGCGGKGARWGHVVGTHHQWLYGHGAVKGLLRMLTMLDSLHDDPDARLNRVSGFNNPVSLLAAVYSVSPSDGYYARVHPLIDDDGAPSTECEDPRRGDNNDGITIIDVRRISEGVVGYCFMALEEGIESTNKVPTLTPLDARTYVEAYYPPDVQPDSDAHAEIADTLGRISATGATLLTAADVVDIFPVLAGVVRGESKRKKTARKITTPGKGAVVELADSISSEVGARKARVVGSAARGLSINLDNLTEMQARALLQAAKDAGL